MAVLIASALFLISLLLLYLLIKSRAEFNEYRLSETNRREAVREDAIKSSRRVLGGKFTEQIAPYLPEFQYDPTEARFIGSPIDLIVFPGLAEGNPREIVLVEIKSGKSLRLTPNEKRVCELVEAGRVRWELLYCPQEDIEKV